MKTLHWCNIFRVLLVHIDHCKIPVKDNFTVLQKKLNTFDTWNQIRDSALVTESGGQVRKWGTISGKLLCILESECQIQSQWDMAQVSYLD